MRLAKWVTCVLISCVACKKPATDPIVDNLYKVTATLNGTSWFGAAYASRAQERNGLPACDANRFTISFSTDIPFDASLPANPVPATGCSGQCVPTQVLTVYNVPTAIGRYDLATLTTCASQDQAATLYWLVGGDAITNTFSARNSGWIEITTYDATRQAIEGRFEIELADRSAKTAQFRGGAFKALIK